MMNNQHNTTANSSYEDLIERDNAGVVTEKGQDTAHNMLLAAMAALLDTNSIAAPSSAMVYVPAQNNTPLMVAVVAREEYAQRIADFVMEISETDSDLAAATRH